MLHEGAVFFTRGEMRVEATVAPGCELISLSVPEEVLPPSLELAVGDPTINAQGTPASAAITEFLRSIADSDVSELSGMQHYFLERLLQEMATALALESAGSRIAPRQPHVFAAALAFIAAQCADSALTAESVAAEVNMSLRQLGRVFARHDTTISREIRRARIEAAVGMLRDRAYDALTIEQVAQHSGFSRGSSLARAMSAEGAGVPSEIRAKRQSHHVASARRVLRRAGRVERSAPRSLQGS
ncbi:MAG: helix-turn-helix domain-containing protein [Microbacterium sp.]